MPDRLDRATPEESVSPIGKERRRSPRQDCRLDAQVLATNSSLRMRGTITDLSLTGCYVEMLSPLPVDAEAEVVLSVGSSTLHILGKVRTSRPGLGMGIEFA